MRRKLRCKTLLDIGISLGLTTRKPIYGIFCLGCVHCLTLFFRKSAFHSACARTTRKIAPAILVIAGSAAADLGHLYISQYDQYAVVGWSLVARGEEEWC